MNLRVGIIVLSLGFLAITFQNCAKTNFNGAENGVYFKAEALPTSGQTSAGNDGSAVTPPQDPSVAPDAPVTPPVSNGVAPKTPGNTDHPVCNNDKDKDDDKDKDHVKAPESEDHSSVSLVECELLSPSMKIKLNQFLDAEHSNNQSSRVCMSENACLKILNSYAADHNCSMDMGAATSPGSPAQCTEIFPGSKGTCHNAKVLSDAAITGILETMAK